ncbi:MAG: serine protease [Polyangiaceae bacterium]|nr:serine protease [Polyangiaceae bacterium]
MKSTRTFALAALVSGLPIALSVGCDGVTGAVDQTKIEESSIVGGKPAEPGAWPWQALVFMGTEPEVYCGGSLIQSQWVLTAEHCVRGLEAADLSVMLGEHRISVSEPGEQLRAVEQIIHHPGFFWTDSNVPVNDIALLRLSAPVENSPTVRTISLGIDHDLAAPGQIATVTGWGETLVDGTSNILRQVNVPIVSDETCAKSYGGDFREGMLCAGLAKGGKDSCAGDSGGPLVALTSSGEHRLVGVVSWGEGCAEKDHYGVYTHVAHYADWIIEEIQSSGPASCTARCCDGTLHSAGDQADANQCVFWGGSGCADNGGPVRVRYGGGLVWEKEQEACDTMRSCSVRCCDDTIISESNHFDKDMCVFFEASKCKDHGGAVRVRFDGEVAWEADPEAVCTNPNACSARCCDGSLIQVGDMADANQCIFWGGFSCADEGGPVRLRHGGGPVWETEQSQCDTMRSCSVQCCDGSFVTTTSHFDKNMCVFFEQNNCGQNGGTSAVRFDGDVAWAGACK